MTPTEQVEIQINVAKEMIATRDSYLRLVKNKDFQNIIEDGYFKEEAARLVMARSNTNLTDQQREAILMMIDGIGALSNYFDMICRRGAEMDAALADHEEALAELSAEEIK